MGNDAGNNSEKPGHLVTLENAFWLDLTEVTNAQYGACVDDQGCQAPSNISSRTRSTYYSDPSYATYPVIWVDWSDADTFCRWAGGRLPTEAEWEYAARGPGSLLYPWGNIFDGSKLNYCDQNCPFPWADPTINDGHDDTSPVGVYTDGASWVGALDMSGNVWEWVSDWFDRNYYAQSTVSNPTGPQSGTEKVLRGGALRDGSLLATGAYRFSEGPNSSFEDQGFRCVQP